VLTMSISDVRFDDVKVEDLQLDSMGDGQIHRKALQEALAAKAAPGCRGRHRGDTRGAGGRTSGGGRGRPSARDGYNSRYGAASEYWIETLTFGHY
jgi:hypothetical protein